MDTYAEDKRIEQYDSAFKEVLDKQKELEKQIVALAKFTSENPNPILRISAKGRVIYKNEGADKLLSQTKFIRKNISKILPKNFKELIKQSLSTGETINGLEMTVKDKVYSYTMVPVIKNRYVNLYGIDITEKKKTEERLRKAMDINSKFTSIVAHELRNPLTILKEIIEAVLNGEVGPVNGEQWKMLNMAEKNTDRLKHLVDEILDVKSLETGKIQLNIQENDINQIIEEVCKMIRPLIRGKGLNCELKFDNNLPKVQIDKEKIIQVLLNLMSNAVKFVKEGYIILGTSKRGNNIHVIVQDNGPGIKPEDIPKLFYSFSQLSDRKNIKEKGAGLGLAICKEIIEMHKGRIWVESNYGAGATFHFELPIS